MANKRQEQAMTTKKRILDASQKLFGAKGYLNTTIEDIATECNIGKGTLYHYFKGKEDIFSYIERGRFEEMHNFIDNIEYKNISEKISHFISRWFECVASDNINVSKDWHRLSVDLKVPSKENRTHLDDDIDNISKYLNEGIANGEFKKTMPVEAVAKDIVFSMYGASFYRCSTYNEFNIIEWSKQYIVHILDLHLTPYMSKLL